MKKGPTEQGPEPQRLSQVPVWIATLAQVSLFYGGAMDFLLASQKLPLVGLLDRKTPTLWRQADTGTLHFQPVATKGVHHRGGRSFRKVGQPTRLQMKTVRRKKEGQKNMPS
jgi:hypothetical protein